METLLPFFKIIRHCRLQRRGSYGTGRYGRQDSAGTLPSTLPPFLPFLPLRRFLALPLHIRGTIRPTSAERFYVVYDVAKTGTLGLARRWARVVLREGRALLRIAVGLGEGGRGNRHADQGNEKPLEQIHCLPRALSSAFNDSLTICF